MANTKTDAPNKLATLKDSVKEFADPCGAWVVGELIDTLQEVETLKRKLDAAEDEAKTIKEKLAWYERKYGKKVA